MILRNDFFNVIDNCICDNSYKVDIVLNPGHYIFKSHFPGNPIVPGVCQIQIITELMEEYLNRKLYLSGIKNIKYISVLIPSGNETLTLLFNKIEKGEDNVKVSVVVSAKDNIYSKISLCYQYHII